MFSFCEFHKKDQLSFAKGGTWTILKIQYNVTSIVKYNDIHRLPPGNLSFPVVSINLNPETEKIIFSQGKKQYVLGKVTMQRIKIKDACKYIAELELLCSLKTFLVSLNKKLF